MKRIICLCIILLSQSVPAALIDFNDIAIGTELSTLDFGSARISTRLWVTQEGTTVSESFTRGVIDDFGGSPAVVMQAGPLDATNFEERQRWNIEIGVSFNTPISRFSLDGYSQTYTSELIYSGVNGLGETFTLSGGVMGGFTGDSTHFDIAAPTGGYITGFYFSQFEDRGTILLTLDNLDYAPTAGGSAIARVPEAIGLPTFIVAICGLLFAHRRVTRPDAAKEFVANPKCSRSPTFTT
jgi:hypothetical protein